LQAVFSIGATRKDRLSARGCADHWSSVGAGNCQLCRQGLSTSLLRSWFWRTCKTCVSSTKLTVRLAREP